MVDSQASLLMYTKSQNENDPKHLFVILNDPCEDKISKRQEVILLVNFTSVREGVDYDTACVVESGSHEFITRKSYILYREARIEQALFVKNGLEAGDFVSKSPVSVDLYGKIVSGLFRSGFAARKYKRFFKSAYGQGACGRLDEELVSEFLL